MKCGIFKRIVICFVILCSIVFIPECKALECDFDKAKELANKVDVTAEFDESSVSLGIYDRNIITIVGLSESIYVTTEDGVDAFYYSEMVNGVVTGRISGNIKKLNVYSKECSNKVLRTIDLSLKVYNPYYESSECEGLEDKVDVCSQYYEKTLTYDEFIKAINKYKNDNVDDGVVNGKDILDILKDNVIIVAIVAVILVSVIVFIFIRNYKKNKLD